MSLEDKSLRLHKKHWSRKLLLEKDDDLEQGDGGGVCLLLMLMTLLITCALFFLLLVLVLVITFSDSSTMLSPTISPAVLTVAAEELRETMFGLWGEAKKDKY